MNLQTLVSKDKNTESKVLVSFIFDDGYSSVYDVVFPLFEKYDIVGDVAIVGSYLNKKGYLTSEQVKELIEAGWSLGDHTFTHPDMNLIDLDRLDKEIKLNRHFIKEFFNHELSYFVFPKSKVKSEHLSFVLGKYICAFTGESRIIANSPPYRGLLKRTQISIYEIFKFSILGQNFLKELIKNIYASTHLPTQRWFILFTHNVSKTPSIFDTPLKHFVNLIRDLTMIKNIEITSIKNVLCR
ncbi:MAG: polysaccharide deacetylase family protein [Thermofilum sp.]|nr:polysaccharide deacetylase family protein [Thermofilum sp.]